MSAATDHAAECTKLASELAAARLMGARIGIKKPASNLFRRPNVVSKSRLDMRRLNRVLSVDRERLVANVEGATTYEDLVDETLQYDLLPAVVPQLKTITAGGAVSGLGIESSSFKFGLVHETVEEMEVLLGDGRIVVCSRNNNSDLFFGFPNSYGTLGYILRLAVRLIPAKRYVRVTHKPFRDPQHYFGEIGELCSRTTADYLDGTIFDGHQMYITRGALIDEAPGASDYSYMNIYYQSIQRKSKDWLTSKGYIWRWDTDWFWCSKHFGVQNPAIRLFAKWALHSRTYQRLRLLSHRLLPDSHSTESVIQDVDIPIEHAPEFFRFLLSEIGILPVWVCPFRTFESTRRYVLSPLAPDKLYINFGFWDTLPTSRENGYFNRRVETKALELHGMKALYSSSYYDEATFWSIYDRERYRELRQKYGAEGVFPDLYEKCVLRS